MRRGGVVSVRERCPRWCWVRHPCRLCVCVCVKSIIFTQLHSARMGYGSCLVFSPLELQILSSNDPSSHRDAGNFCQGGATQSHSPQNPPGKKRKKTENTKTKLSRSERQNETSRPGDGPPPASPFHTNPGGGPGPPSSPSTSALSSSEPSPPPPASPRGGVVTICPTFVFRRKDSTALVALSSPKSKAILGALGCFHPQR